MGFMSIAKPFRSPSEGWSGDLLDGRVAFRPAREAPLGTPWGASAGFRRLRGRAHLRQKPRNDAMDPEIGVRRPVS
jgi:hypothetical protein